MDPSIQTCHPSVPIGRQRTEEGGIYIGADTHKKACVPVASDDQGPIGRTHTMTNTPSGWAAALGWAHRLDATCIRGIENSGSLGKGLAQFRLCSGETAVYEIVPHRTEQ
jgi:hypothetical protein